MADDETVFVEVWEQRWAKVPAPQKLGGKGAVRRVHVGALLGKTMPRGAAAGSQLIDGIFADLGTLLKAGAVAWSPAPGLIDVFYPNLLPAAADLAQSVLRSAIERRIQKVVGAAIVDQSLAEVPRRVEPEEFQRICRKAKAGPEHIQTIDLSEIIFGKADPAVHLSRRAWRIVDAILDEFLAAGGHGARQAGNQILLFFPGLAPSLARLKRKAIAAEIAQQTKGIALLSGDPDAEPLAEPALPTAPPPKPRRAPTHDPREVALLNQAFAKLAATGPAETISDDALTEQVGFRIVPIWRTRNQALVGHLIAPDEATEKSGLLPEILDLACLVRAQADIHQGIMAKSPYLVLAPLSWATLERSRSRGWYFERAARLAEESRRYLVLSLTEIPEDLMAARIEERVQELRRFCRTISCRVTLERRDFDQFRGMGIHALGLKLAADGSAERDVMASMIAFLDALAPLQARSFIDGLHTKSLAIAALAAGFDYLSGSAIIDSGGRVQGVRAFSIADLYESIAT